MRAALFAALIACAPVAATALSCMPHSVEAAFLEAQAAEARFVIVRGRLSFHAHRLPKADMNNQQATPEMTEIKAKLTGKSLSLGGFTTPYNKPVTLAVACFGPWCANVSEGSDVLAFVELGPDGGRVATNPCGGYLFPTPTAKTIRAVKDCFVGKDCKPVR